jgi:cell division protein FtsI/penicillin-binding protein 2
LVDRVLSGSVVVVNTHLAARRRLTTCLVALVSVAALGACTSSQQESPQQRVAAEFLTAFGARQVDAAATKTTDPAASAVVIRRSLTGLGTAAKGHFETTAAHTDHGRTSVSYTARWSLTGSPQPWTYHGALAVVKRDGHWSVKWAAGDLHPQLRAGFHLAVRRVQPLRATLLDSSGQPLFAETPVVRVGLEKQLITDLPALARTLAAIPQLQSTRAEIVAAVKQAAPTTFVPVITLRRPVYDQIRAKIHDLPGTVFQTDTLLLPPTNHFAQPLLGSVGPATADVIAHSHGRIVAGDTTGVGGLQQAYDSRLAGHTGLVVVAEADSGDAAGTTPRQLAVVAAPRPGTPVKLTIDPPAQNAAERALARITKPAAIIAVQRSTGRILADANTPAATYDYALSGAFPPGSSFKIATWAAVFTDDPSVTPSTRVACPATKTVDGRRFINENQFSHPPITIAAAFGYSCNTSAMTAALALPTNALANTARTLGLGGSWSLPVPAFSGSLPAPKTRTERAADAIGQGRVLASPLLMALMASAADGGKVVTPSLAVGVTPHTTTLPAALTAKMRTLMTATVAMPGGTAHSLAKYGDLRGKTGTAEYGTATPPRSHSWFAGVRGDVAFAVFVYDGATTGVNAVPIAGDFLAALR